MNPVLNKPLWRWAGLLGVLVLGAALRLRHLGLESLWLDEAWAVELAHSSLAHIVSETGKDVHPPLYYFLLHYWVRAVGSSEAAVRLMSVVASVGAIGVLYALASRLFSERTGIWAAFLAAIMPFQIEFAQEARMYALLSLLSLCSLYGFVRLIETGRRRSFACYVLATALLMYTHAYSVFVLLAEAFTLIVLALWGAPAFRRYLKRTALAGAVAILLFLPWLPIILRQVLQVQHGFWIPDSNASGLVDAVVLYSGSESLAWIVSGLAIVGLCLGLRATTAPREPAGLTGPVMLFWLLCPTVIPLLLSQVSAPIFLPKYTIAGSLAFLTLAGRAIAIAPQRMLRVAIAAVIVWSLWLPMHAYYDVERKVDWRTTVAGIDADARPGDVVFFNSSFGRIPFDYYSHRRDLVSVPFMRDHDVLTDHTLRDFVSYSARGREGAWVVLSNRDELSDLLMNQLSRDRVVTGHVARWGLEVYRFEPKARAEHAP